jgi:hypothetical protein
MKLPVNIIARNIAEYAESLPGLGLILGHMEKVERWVAKKGHDQGFNRELETRLYKLDEEQVRGICNKEDELLWVLFFLPTSTSFYLLSCLKNINPDLPYILLKRSDIIMTDGIGDCRSAQVYIDRCKHLSAGDFISSLINDDFNEKLTKAIIKVKKGSGDVY